MTQYMRVQCSRGTEGWLTKYHMYLFFLVFKHLVVQFSNPLKKKVHGIKYYIAFYLHFNIQE